MTSLAGGRSSGSKTNTSTKRPAKAEPKSKKRGGLPVLPFEVRSSPVQGLGGFATRHIAKGTRIVEYLGQRISDEEADRRYDDDAMDRHHTFLFSLGDGTSIDAAVNGNDARFINHSCAPNCEAINEDEHIFIEALRDIEPGEELFYDYAYERGGGDDDEDLEAVARFYVCKCGAPTCRGSILAIPEEKKRSKKKTTKSAAKGKKAPATKGRGASKAPAGGRTGTQAEGRKARSKKRA